MVPARGTIAFALFDDGDSIAMERKMVESLERRSEQEEHKIRTNTGNDIRMFSLNQLSDFVSPKVAVFVCSNDSLNASSDPHCVYTA